MICKINSLRPAIADTYAGKKMTVAQANSGHVNPHIGEDEGYELNCQACVVVYEARLRGYDVEALPFKFGSTMEKLAYDPRLAWVDPVTREHPGYLYDESLRTPKEYLEFINNTVKQGERYTIQFCWAGRYGGGHIVNLDRTDSGELRIKDNQASLQEKNTWIGDHEVLGYLCDMKFEPDNWDGIPSPCVPKLLRIDNMDFDYSIVNEVMKGA